ncbi:MAG TPA: copper resistance CopC family protein, partial [Acidimicrobiales bacterium]
MLVLTPGRADAHAQLESTVPADGDRLDAAPEQVLLRFSESVEVADDGVVVYDGSGEALDTSPPDHPGGEGSAVAVDLPDVDDGAYVVSWRVVSADGHPISGAFSFEVGDVAPGAAAALEADLGAGPSGDRVLGVVYGVVRFLGFAGVVVLVGGAAFVLVLWPGGLRDRWTRRLVVAGFWVTVGATVASFGLQGAYGAGLGLADALDPSVIGDEVGARAGRVWLVRLVV